MRRVLRLRAAYAVVQPAYCHVTNGYLRHRFLLTIAPFGNPFARPRCRIAKWMQHNANVSSDRERVFETAQLVSCALYQYPVLYFHKILANQQFGGPHETQWLAGSFRLLSSQHLYLRSEKTYCGLLTQLTASFHIDEFAIKPAIASHSS